MFDIGWTEMLVVAVIAIIFVGPKELPGMIRTFGRSVKKLRAMAGDFQSQFDDALKEAELDGIKDTINDVKSLDPTAGIKDKLNPLKDTQDTAPTKPAVRSAQEVEAEIARDYAAAQEAIAAKDSPKASAKPSGQSKASEKPATKSASKKSAPAKKASTKAPTKKATKPKAKAPAKKSKGAA